MLPQNNRTATDSRSRCSKAKGLRRWAAALCCILLAPLGRVAAQGLPPSSVNLPTPEMPDRFDATIEFQKLDKKPLKFTARAHYILVPVIVTDKDGKHVQGLTRETFQIFEDGKEQTIASVDEVKTFSDPVQRIPGSQNEFSNMIAPEGGARRINVIALDLLNTPFLDQAGARQAAIRYLANSINQDAVFELVSIDGNGMHVLHDFTTDTKVLIAALKRVAGQLDAMAGMDTGTIRQATANPALEPEGAIPPATSNAQLESHKGIAVTYNYGDKSQIDFDSTALEAFARGALPIANFAQMGAVSGTLGAFQQLAQQLSGVPGRKSLFWITGSFPFDIDDTGGSISVGAPYDAYQRTMQLLNNSNISLYPVDARGLVVVGEMDATMRVSREMIHTISEYMAGESKAHQKTLDTMRIFADTTGGKAYYNTNNLVGALSDAVNDGASYYTLSYALDTKNTRPGWRKLKVKVKDPDYHTRSRQGVFVTQTTLDPNNSEGMDIREALTSPLDYTGMPLSIKLDTPVDNGGRKKVGFSLLVPANAATVDATDNDRLNLEIWYVVRNVKGEEVSHNSKLYNLNLNAAFVAQLQTSGIGYNDTVELPPGRYGLRVVVRDNITGRVGSVWAPLEVN